jgi:HAD superfamily hydrolase (TIGR01549 family)
MTCFSCDIVIFDMDGTLTRSTLDFDEIRAAIGIVDAPILESILKMKGDARLAAERLLVEFEDRDAYACELQPHAIEIVRAVRAAGKPAVLMTRNTRRSVDILHQRHGFEFDRIHTREDGPVKPDPEPVLHICRSHEVAPESAWVIGDYHYDLLCANAAGATSVLLAEADAELPDWSSDARYVVRSLAEFAALIGVDLDLIEDVADVA